MLGTTIECRCCYYENGEPGGPLAEGPQRLITESNGLLNTVRHNEHKRTILSILYRLECGHQVAS
jgi:hypothetical protein